jgi:hypothetical protein
MKTRFDKGYLISAGIILAFTASGKVPSFHLSLCIEFPMLGNHQPTFISNAGISGLAAGAEFAVLAMILFSPVRWLPCLASASWGALCLTARFLLFKDGFQHCRCLGWVDAPPVTVAAIAVWLAVGGTISFWQSWRDARLVDQASGNWGINLGFRCCLLWGITVACFFWGQKILLNMANYDEYKELDGPLSLVIAGPLIAIALVSLLRSFRKPLRPRRFSLSGMANGLRQALHNLRLGIRKELFLSGFQD